MICKEKKLIKTDQFHNKFLDIPYGDESENQRMDIYLPNGNGLFPTVMHIHGGAWMADSKRCMDTACIFKIISQGYALVTVDYRLSGEAKWPAQFLDVRTAASFIKHKGGKYGLRTDKLVVWGNSAGGHLAQMLAANGITETEKVDGLISWYGLGNLTADNEEEGKRYPIELLIGKKFEEDPQSYLEASPYKHVKKDFPPALFQHGIEDKLVSWKQSEKMFRRVTEICDPTRAKLELFPGGHGAPAIKDDENIRRCIQFFDSLYGIKRNYLDMKFPEILLEE